MAPADALTISKLSRGHCDNLLTCALLAWPLPASDRTVLPSSSRLSKPLVICPSMNTCMLAHPATVENLRLIRAFGAVVEGPVSKRLMCGDVGSGAMQEPDKVAERVLRMAMGETTDPLLCDFGGIQWVLAAAGVVVIAGCAHYWISKEST